MTVQHDASLTAAKVRQPKSYVRMGGPLHHDRRPVPARRAAAAGDATLVAALTTCIAQPWQTCAYAGERLTSDPSCWGNAARQRCADIRACSGVLDRSILSLQNYAPPRA